MIKIIIADDHNLFREGIRSLLSGIKDILIVGEVENGKELIKKYFELNPDVILTDISMPVKSGPAAIKSILFRRRDAKVLFLSQYTGDDYLYSVIKSGGLGLVSKNCLKEELVNAIREVNKGNKYFKGKDDEELDFILKRFDNIKGKSAFINGYQLTAKEEEVISLVGEGLSSEEIAEKLSLSRRTVDTHRSRIMSILGLKTVSELIRFAVLKNVEDKNKKKL